MRITKEARCAKNAREYIDNRPRLVEGKIYTLIFRQQPERSEKHTAIKKRMRFLKAFPHHALFENPYGIKRSFTWWQTTGGILRNQTQRQFLHQETSYNLYLIEN